MLNFINEIIDTFCKDTVIGLTEVNFEKKSNSNEKNVTKQVNKPFRNIMERTAQNNVIAKKSAGQNMRIYKNYHEPLFHKKAASLVSFNKSFTDPSAYRLLTTFQNQKVLCSV